MNMDSIIDMLSKKEKSLCRATIEYRWLPSDPAIKDIPWRLMDSVPLLAGGKDEMKKTIDQFRKKFIRDYLLMGDPYVMRLAIYDTTFSSSYATVPPIVPIIAEYPSSKLVKFKRENKIDYRPVDQLQAVRNALSSAINNATEETKGPMLEDPEPIIGKDAREALSEMTKILLSTQGKEAALLKAVEDKADKDTDNYLKNIDDGGILRCGEQNL